MWPGVTMTMLSALVSRHQQLTRFLPLCRSVWVSPAQNIKMNSHRGYSDQTMRLRSFDGKYFNRSLSSTLSSSTSSGSSCASSSCSCSSKQSTKDFWQQYNRSRTISSVWQSIKLFLKRKKRKSSNCCMDSNMTIQQFYQDLYYREKRNSMMFEQTITTKYSCDEESIYENEEDLYYVPYN